MNAHVLRTFGQHCDSIPRPMCQNCRVAMMLCRIAPEKPGLSKHTFECPSCEHSESVVSEYKLV